MALREGDTRPYGEYEMRYRTEDTGASKPRHHIEVHHPEDGEVGFMTWMGSAPYAIHRVEVNPDHQRKGLATAMWNWAQEEGRPKPRHSRQRTDSGDDWARSVGGPLPRRQGMLDYFGGSDGPDHLLRQPREAGRGKPRRNPAPSGGGTSPADTPQGRSDSGSVGEGQAAPRPVTFHSGAFDPHGHVRWGDGTFRSFRDAWGASRGNSTMITGASAHLMGLKGYTHDDQEYMSGTEKERLALANHALHVIHKSKDVGSPEELYHGTTSPKARKLQPGDEVRLPLTATSGHQATAAMFADAYRDKPGTIVHFPKGTPFYPQDRNPPEDRDEDYNHQWSEAITAGHFRVAHREERDGVTHLHLEHHGTFNPHTKQWEAATSKTARRRPKLKSRIFGPTKGGLDPRLFEGTKLRPEVRSAILERLGAVVEPLLGPEWKYALDVYLAGSEASEWWGNDDLDVLVGIDYDHAEESPAFQRIVGIEDHGPTDEDITALLNQAFWNSYNDEDWHAPFGGVWHATAYANPIIGGGNIKKVKPYAAYDIQRDAWVVKPPHLESWSLADFPEGPELLKEAEAYADLIEAIDKMPEPYRTRQGKALWDHLHSERSRAFSDEGEGWSDTGNAIEKALNEWGLWDKLVQMKYGERKVASWDNREISSLHRGMGVDLSEDLHAYDFQRSYFDEPVQKMASMEEEKPIDLPVEQAQAIETDDYMARKNKLLDLAKNPVPGTHIWRGETRSGDPVEGALSSGVGLHWSVNPDNLVHPFPEKGERNVVYHAEVEHPGEQNIPRSHPMWRGRHQSMDSEAEVRLRPGAKVKLHGVWVKDPEHPDPGYLAPRWPTRTGPGWTYHPIGKHVDVAHRPKTDLIDYSDVGLPREAGKNGDLSEGLTFEHRPPNRRYPNEHVLIARHPDAPHGPYSNWVGHLTWFDDDGQIGNIAVAEPYQRRGVATELYRRAREITPELYHSDDISPDGKKWISSLGAVDGWAHVRGFMDPKDLKRSTPAVIYHEGEDEDAEDMRQHGIHTPIQVRYEKGTSQIMNGHHRHRVAEEMGWPRVPVLVRYREGDDPPAIDQMEPITYAEYHHGPGQAGHFPGWERLKSLGLRLVIAQEDEDDYRMQHRPPNRDDETAMPLHDLTRNMPADVYTHPEYYGLTGDPNDLSYSDSHAVIRRVRGRPDAKVRIYRSLPAEHAHRGFRPGDWVTLSKDYARQHGMQEDPKHDWPVISTVVRADDLHTHADDLREWGYNGSDVKKGSVAYKGGYHQEIRQRENGEIHRVTRKPRDTSQEMWGSHTLKLSPEDYHHVVNSYMPDEAAHKVLKHLGPDVTWHPQGSQHGPREVDDPKDPFSAELHAEKLMRSHHRVGEHEPGTTPLLGVLVHTKNGKTIDQVKISPHVDYSDLPRGFYNGFNKLPMGRAVKHPSLPGHEAAYGDYYGLAA